MWIVYGLPFNMRLLGLWFVLILAESACGLRIGAFNVKTLGQTKMSKPIVVDYLVKIITRYDLIVLQELRDVSGGVIAELLTEVNGNSSDQYAMILGARAGRSASYKEQYVFMYKKNAMTATGHYDYADPKDQFEREPLVVRFQVPTKCSGRMQFAVAGFHAKPNKAVQEIDSLVDVHDDIVNRWKLRNIAIVGDFNAGCSYVRKFEWEQIRLRNDSQYHWLIPDEADTTVSPNTFCAYDRLVVTGNLVNTTHSPSVFYFDKHFDLTPSMAVDISDHYPVEMVIKTSKYDKCPSPRGGNQSVHGGRHIWSFIAFAVWTSFSFCR